ncbi:MAG: type II secretion system minor pseudopilin GspI [Pseudomonadota bacterium]
MRNCTIKAVGFTLIEVLVAITITSIALIAGSKAAMSLADNSSRQATSLLANLCAENELANIRLSKVMPPVGVSTVSCEQAGRMFTIQVTVVPTANSSFRRIDVRALSDYEQVASLWSLVGQN